jgi:hypothetical protein
VCGLRRFEGRLAIDLAMAASLGSISVHAVDLVVKQAEIETDVGTITATAIRADADSDVNRKPPCRSLCSQPFKERRRIVGTVLLVRVRLAGEVVLENGRRRHGAIVAGRKKAPGFWPGAEVRTFGEGKEVR